MGLTKKEFVQINQALFSLVHAYEVRMDEEEIPLTVTQRSLIMVLGQLAPINSKTLAKAMNLSPGPVSLHVHQLSKKNLVSMERDEVDKRNWWLNLTEAGRQLYEETVDAAVDYTQDFFSVLDEEELKSLHRILYKTTRGLGYDWQ